MNDKVSSEKVEVLISSNESKRIEDALRESEEMYRSIVELAPDSIVTVNLKGVVTSCNSATTRISGFSKDEIVGKHISKLGFLRPKDIPKYLEIFSSILRGKVPEPFEIAWQSKDGTPHLAEVLVSLIKRKGKTIGIQAMVRDITESKLTQKILRESEEKYRKLFEEAMDAIIVADVKTGILIDCNRAASELVGRQKSELTGKHQRILHPEKNTTGFTSSFKQHLKDKEGQVIETQIITKNGEIKDVAIKASLFDIKGMKVLQGIFRDITERKEAEEVLRESEERYRALFEQAPIGIGIATSDAIVIDANQGMQAITGYSKEELEKINLSDTYENPEQRKALLESARQHGAVVNFPVRLKRKNGNLYDALLNVSSIHVGGKSFLQTICQDVTERKKAEEALLAERDRLETVTRNIGAGLAIISKDYRTLWANDVLKQIFGDVEGKICYSTYNQRNSICPECGVHEIFETGKAKVVHEQVGNDVDGKTIWSEITATPIKDKDGNITSVLELVVRITERKQLEESIKESQERLKNIFAASPDAITVSDSNGNIIECNQATLDMLGFSSKEELIGKNGYELIAKKDHQKATKNLKKTLDQGEVRNIEYTFLTRDGHEFPTELSASVLKDSSGKVVGFVSVAKNISERKKAEEELRKFKTISDKAGYGSAISDLEGNLIYVNESLAKMHGFTADELIGKNLSIFHPKVQMKNVARLKEQLRQKGSYVSEEVWHKRRDNTVFPTLMNGTLIRDEKGKPLFMAATAVDITERKRMEDELKRYSEHLEELVEQRTRKLKEAHEQLLKTERLAAIGELATMVAHDLRNPLTSIRNAGFYIKNSCPARATGECKTALEMLDIIDQEIIFTNNIINHLLDFAAKRPLQKKKQNINSLIDDSLKRIHIPQNINVERKYTKKATAAVDEKQLERVFINLTRNAVQAMPNGGTLTITTNETKDHIEIAFTDTGTGIQKENMNKLFSPLFTTKAKGIGIGLAICKKIVEQHGGTIEARSKAGQGTTFTIKLLKKEEANAQ
jgi:PAS domain S-box-containing protein